MKCSIALDSSNDCTYGMCPPDISVNILCVRNKDHIRLRIILVLTFEMFSEVLKFIDFWGKHLNKIVIFHQKGLRGQVVLKMVYLCTFYPLDELWMRLIIKMQHFQFGLESCKCDFFLIFVVSELPLIMEYKEIIDDLVILGIVGIVGKQCCLHPSAENKTFHLM